MPEATVLSLSALISAQQTDGHRRLLRYKCFMTSLLAKVNDLFLKLIISIHQAHQGLYLQFEYDIFYNFLYLMVCM